MMEVGLRQPGGRSTLDRQVQGPSVRRRSPYFLDVPPAPGSESKHRWVIGAAEALAAL